MVGESHKVNNFLYKTKNNFFLVLKDDLINFEFIMVCYWNHIHINSIFIQSS